MVLGGMRLGCRPREDLEKFRAWCHSHNGDTRLEAASLALPLEDSCFYS